MSLIVFLVGVNPIPAAAQGMNITSVDVLSAVDQDNEEKLMLKLRGSGWSQDVSVTVTMGTLKDVDNLDAYWYSIYKEEPDYYFSQSLDGEIDPIVDGDMRVLIDYPSIRPSAELWTKVCVNEGDALIGCRHIRIR